MIDMRFVSKVISVPIDSGFRRLYPTLELVINCSPHRTPRLRAVASTSAILHEAVFKSPQEGLQSVLKESQEWLTRIKEGGSTNLRHSELIQSPPTTASESARTAATEGLRHPAGADTKPRDGRVEGLPDEDRLARHVCGRGKPVPAHLHVAQDVGRCSRGKAVRHHGAGAGLPIRGVCVSGRGGRPRRPKCAGRGGEGQRTSRPSRTNRGCEPMTATIAGTANQSRGIFLSFFLDYHSGQRSTAVKS
jgi:hypothetical protein